MPSDLTVGLVADWELIANANDSTPHGYTLTNTGGVTFGANGASFNGIDQMLSLADGTVIDTSQPWFLMYEASDDRTNSTDSCPVIQKGEYSIANPDLGYSAFANFGGVGLNSSVTSGPQWASADNTYSNSYSVALDLGIAPPVSRKCVMGYQNVAGLLYSQWVDDGAAQTSVLGTDTPPDHPFNAIGRFSIGAAPSMFGDTFGKTTVRRVRWWIGAGAAVAAQDANRTWLFNSGAGRTYAEILATASTGMTGEIVGQDSTSANRSFVDA